MFFGESKIEIKYIYSIIVDCFRQPSSKTTVCRGGKVSIHWCSVMFSVCCDYSDGVSIKLDMVHC